MDLERLLAQLNPPQRQAITHGEGPVLILAGAGSGKTRVITRRIAYLVGALGVTPREIVAVTFTNKAAGEMKHRAEELLGQELIGAFVGTFHSFGLRILRAHAVAAGLAPDFVIYDTTDQTALMRQLLREQNIDDKTTPPRQILGQISKLKNAFIDPAAALNHARFPDQKQLAALYELYEQRLRNSGAVDFDDLLVWPVRLFEAHPEIHERYANRIRFLLVDEYQDTNPLQYRLIAQLTAVHRNICCVGDEDQSIYAFRGADIRNILEFKKDFPNATIIKLEQNYRSTKSILSAASAVISNNKSRHEKTLWTAGEQGEPILLHTARDDRAEADHLVNEIRRLGRQMIPLEEIGILYRTNAQSRLIEDRLVAANIPYRIVGSLRFYERKEIKDLIAWLRLLVHPDSEQDYLRAAGTPPRGIGDKTLEQLAAAAQAGGMSLFQATQQALSHPGDLGGRAIKPLQDFLSTIRDLTDVGRTSGVNAAVQTTLDVLGYLDYLERANPSDHESRKENIGAFLAAAREHDEAGAPGGLAGFLDRVSLRSDTDDVQGRRGPSLMTVHAAKGLEFDAVLIAGLNEELFPHAFSKDTESEIEEERRLLYVAMTRARRFLGISLALVRRPFGRPAPSPPSRFIMEIPAAHLRQTQDPLCDIPTSNGSLFPRESARGFALGSGGHPATRPAGISGPPAATERRVVFDAEEGPAGFWPGMRVQHPHFGLGTVLSVEGKGPSTKLQIRFERAGIKKILPQYTTLMPA